MLPLQVPDPADQISLTADGLHPSTQGLAKALNGLDDTEDWFNGAFSLGIKGSAVSCLQPTLDFGQGISALR